MLDLKKKKKKGKSPFSPNLLRSQFFDRLGLEQYQEHHCHRILNIVSRRLNSQLQLQ